MKQESNGSTIRYWGYGKCSDENWKEDLVNERSEKKSRQFRPQHSKDQLEYLEESWKPEEVCCQFSEKTF